MQRPNHSTRSTRIPERREGAYCYVLITPARNEADTIELTIQSVVRQTIRPAKWVIVSDGSTDGTDELVSKFGTQYDWIELVRKSNRSERHFAGKVDAFNAGYAKVKDLEFEIVGNLDADVSFDDPSYFEFLVDKFAENPRLGVCSTSYWEGNLIYPSRFTSIEDVMGACQMFRRDCFDDIGGYLPMRAGGVDLVAFLSARAKGWHTRTFKEKSCLHHRKVGSAQHKGAYERLLQTGRKDCILGSHPLWEILRGLYQAKSKPYVIGSILTLTGYFWAMLSGVEKTMPKELIELRRNDQMQRLKGILRRAPSVAVVSMGREEARR